MNRRDLLASMPLAFAAAAAVPLIAHADQNAQPLNPNDSTWDRIQKTKTLRIGAPVMEPWYFKDSSGSNAPGAVVSNGVTWRGVGISFAQAVAEAMNVKLEIVETTWANAVAGLQTGQFDTFVLLDATPTRALSVNFVPTPLLWYPLALLAKDDAKIANWQQVNDPAFIIGVGLGTTWDEFITKEAPKATISRFQSSAEIFAAFQSGRINAGLISAVAADLARARIGSGKTLVPAPKVYIPGGIAVRQENDSRWLNYLNTCAGYFYNTGKSQQFYETFLSFRGIDPKSVIPVQRESA